jgi:hypothetical protein
MLGLAEEAEVGAHDAGIIIDRFCDVSSQFSTVANDLYPDVITQETLRTIQSRMITTSSCAVNCISLQITLFETLKIFPTLQIHNTPTVLTIPTTR